MLKWPRLAAAAAVALAVGLPSTAAKAEEMDLIFAIPVQSLTVAGHWVAHEYGLFKKEGLNVVDRVLIGVAAPNAVLAGSADVTVGTGPTFLRAAAQGKPFFAIANLVDRPLVEVVMRKDVADAAGITPSMPPRERAKALKGKTIAIQGVGSIVHSWQRYVASMGGLDVEKDVRITPMDPAAMFPALESKAVDGYTSSMPFTTQAVIKGSAVVIANSTFDAPELVPFAYSMIYTRPEFCKEKAEACTRIVRAYSAAAAIINDKPDEVFEKVIRKRLPKSPPDLLAEAWKVAQQAHPRDIRVNKAMLDNSQKMSLDSKLLDPRDALASYDNLFSDEFFK